MKNSICLALILTLFGCGANPVSIQGGESHINYLQKIRDGVVFSEGFENDNFINADGWTVLQGTPANTSNQYKAGIKSWDNSANSQSLPVAKKVLTDTGFTSGWVCEVYFYDDASKTNPATDPGPVFTVHTSDGNLLQIGVRNSVSTTRFCYGINGSFSSLGPAVRSTGWHFFRIQKSGSSHVLFTTEFGGTNASTTGVLNPDYVSVGACLVGETGTSFGYFDSLGCYKDGNLSIFGLSATNKTTIMFDSTYLIYDGPTTGDFTTNLLAGPPITTFPANVYFQISQSSKATSLLNATPLTSVSPGDIFEFNDIDFERKFTSMQTTDMASANQNQSAAKKREVINFGIQDQHSFTMTQLEGVVWRQVADNFFYYAREGGPFSVMVDDINDNALGVISSFKQAGTTKKVIVMPNLSTNPTDAFTVGGTYTLQQQFNTDKEVVTLASKDTNSLTFNEDLTFDVNQGDYVYSQFFFPFQELPSQNLGGFQQVNAQNIRYTWTLPTQDFIQG